MQFKIWLENVDYRGPIQSHGRDIVVVPLANGDQQAFYRSSGESSGMKGHWLPFDGIGVMPGGHEWFDKFRFTRNQQLMRYGTEELKHIGSILDQMNIPAGTPVEDKYEVNLFINTKYSLVNNKNWEIISSFGK